LSKQTSRRRIGLDNEADVKNVICPIALNPPPLHILSCVYIYIRSKYCIGSPYIRPIIRDYRLTDDPVFHQTYSCSRDHVFYSTHNIIRVCCVLKRVISISPFRNRVLDEFYTKVQKKKKYEKKNVVGTHPVCSSRTYFVHTTRLRSSVMIITRRCR